MFNLSAEVISVLISGTAALLVTFTTMIWRVSTAKSSIEEKILETEHKSELERAKLREDMLRAKIEAFNTYIHKDSFDAAIKNLEARLLRLETKLDKVLEIAINT